MSPAKRSPSELRDPLGWVDEPAALLVKQFLTEHGDRLGTTFGQLRRTDQESSEKKVVKERIVTDTKSERTGARRRKTAAKSKASPRAKKRSSKAPAKRTSKSSAKPAAKSPAKTARKSKAGSKKRAGARNSTPAKASNVFELGESVTIADCSELAKALLEHTRQHQSIKLDGSSVARIDTAGAQLLVSLMQECRRNDWSWSLAGTSEPLQQAAESLNLAAQLSAGQ